MFLINQELFLLMWEWVCLGDGRNGSIGLKRWWAVLMAARPAVG